MQKALLTLALVSAAATSEPGRAAEMALTGATIYPSPSDAPLENASLLVRDGKIVDLGPASTVRVPRSAAVIDCRGLVVTAGFWNSHVHIFTPPLLAARTSAAPDLARELDMMFNRWGFTTVFDISSVLANTAALRRRIQSGELRGPLILTVGEPVWTVEPVYVRGFLGKNLIRIERTESPEQAVALVRDHAAKGADGIKLFTGSWQGEDNVAVLPLPVARAAVKEAHRHGMVVFAHPQDSEGLRVAVESGADVLAHTIPQSPPWTSDFATQLSRSKLALIPTLTLFDFEAAKEKLPDSQRKSWLDKMVGQVREYSRAGGDILFGTDVGYTDRFDTEMEFRLMSQAGMSFREILASLTTTPAGRFGRADRTGRLAKGFDADMVVLSADPARDVTAFSRVRYTIRSGKIMYSAK